MKYRPSVSFLLCLLGIAVVETEVIRTMGRGEPALENLPADPATVEFAEKRKQPIQWSMSDEELAAATAAAGGEAKRKLLEKFPIFAFQGGPAPDERNVYDFLGRQRERQREQNRRTQPVQFSNQPNSPLARLADMQKPESFRALLAEPEYGEVIARIEHLASLRPPASPQEARQRLDGFSQQGGTDCIKALLNKAMLAARAKEEAEALRLVEAAIRLSSHFDEMENPIESVFMGFRREFIHETSLKSLLRDIGSGADLPRWRETLATIPAPSASTWAGHMRESWHVQTDRLLAVSFDPANAALAPILRTAHRDFSSRLAALLELVEQEKPGVLLAWITPPPPAPHLSPERKKLVELATGSSFGNGYPRALASRIQTLAALDLLILEKSGATLDATSMEQISTGLLASESPRFDPATRKLSFAPAIQERIRLVPVKLPW